MAKGAKSFITLCISMYYQGLPSAYIRTVTRRRGVIIDSYSMATSGSVSESLSSRLAAQVGGS